MANTILPPFAATGMIDQLKAAADIIDEASATEIYFGFCDPKPSGRVSEFITTEASDNWSIMKITVNTTTGTVTTFKWAYGTCAYNLVWNNRTSYTYSFKVF